jgi:hypothetical protein
MKYENEIVKWKKEMETHEIGKVKWKMEMSFENNNENE